ncbi:MAG TPA: hypothetical protein VE591_13035 [Candidatus Acidoferrum sp.]|nr:hypothetical protein [Candidatus Acidoferrum sp.]
MDLALIALIGWGGLLAIGVSMALSAKYIPPEQRCTCKARQQTTRLSNVITENVSFVALESPGDVGSGSVVERTCRIYLN